MEETKKFALTSETIVFKGKKLYRIIALRDFDYIHKGSLGGYVESEDNLSQNGNSWIFDEAKVFGKAYISGNAKIFGYSVVFGNAAIFDDALVLGCANVFENACIFGHATIRGFATVSNFARVYDYANIENRAIIGGNACLCGHARVCDSACIYERALVTDFASVRDSSLIGGRATINGRSYIRGNAEIFSDYDFFVVKNVFETGKFLTYTRSNNMWSAGCYYGDAAGLVNFGHSKSKCLEYFFKATISFVNDIFSNLEQ